MKLLTYGETKEDIDLLKSLRIKEVIIGTKELSRVSKLGTNESVNLIEYAATLGFSVFLDWDVLVTENEMDKQVLEFLKFKDLPLTAIRTQDIGIANYIKEKTNFQMHLILESGNHNLVAIQSWLEAFEGRVTRAVVSSELNQKTLSRYAEELDVELEYMGWGRILLFYTPRKLVSIYDRFEFVNGQIEVSGKSEESPHKGFPIIENSHGTFMYHMRELFLFDKLEELKQTGVKNIRVDLRHRGLNSFPELQSLIESEGDLKGFKLKHSPKAIRGYFQTNKSDVLFRKLKNSRVQRKDNDYIGEVLESNKDKYMAIELKSQKSLAIGDEVLFVNPDGKNKIIKVERLRDSSGNSLNQTDKGLVLTDYVGGIWVKAQVYQKNTQGESGLAY